MTGAAAGMRPRRLLMTADTVGGVWQYATDLARALQPHGYHTLLAVMGPPPDPAQRAVAREIPGLTLMETGLKLDWLASDASTVKTAGRRLAEIAGDTGADIVQLNAPALAADVRFPAPVVAVTHSCVATWWDAVVGGDLPPDFVWRAELTGQGLRAADKLVSPSMAIAEATARTYRLAERPSVIFNGRAPLPLRRTAMHDFAFTAGRLWDSGKDLATLDRAAARLGIPFKAAGPLSGPNGESIRFKHLVPIGNLDQTALGKCLAPRPVFVSAARYEPFGLAVLEAASAGCALILADIPTFRELWHGAALFVALGNARAFARAIEDVICDAPRRMTLGNSARRRAGRFSTQSMAAAMAAIYRSLERIRAERVAA